MTLTVTTVLLPGQLDGVVGEGLLDLLVGVPSTPAEVQRAASTIYGLYTGCVYLTPLGGGFLADKLLGKVSPLPRPLHRLI